MLLDSWRQSDTFHDRCHLSARQSVHHSLMCCPLLADDTPIPSKTITFLNRRRRSLRGPKTGTCTSTRGGSGSCSPGGKVSRVDKVEYGIYQISSHYTLYELYWGEVTNPNPNPYCKCLIKLTVGDLWSSLYRCVVEDHQLKLPILVLQVRH